MPFRRLEQIVQRTHALTVAGEEVVRLDEADFSALSRLCLRSTTFFELIDGRPATEATAAEILGPLAPEYAHGTKHVFGLKLSRELIAVAELLQGYPHATDWYIGLLLIDPSCRRQGLGARFCAGMLTWIRQLGGSAVRLVVQEQNADARMFWERQGFEIESERERVSVLVLR